ncbi:MAG: hypothetical protein O9341_17445 [Paucibacter sp.]|nr:hypothetical protein [Roseateles sp.]
MLQHLAAHPERFWVDSFVNIARHLRAQRAGLKPEAAAGASSSGR